MTPTTSATTVVCPAAEADGRDERDDGRDELAGLAEGDRVDEHDPRRRAARVRFAHVAMSRTCSARWARSSATRWATSASRCQTRTVPCEDAVSTATVDSPNSCWRTPRVTSTVWMREIGTSVQVRVSQPVSV